MFKWFGRRRRTSQPDGVSTPRVERAPLPPIASAVVPEAPRQRNIRQLMTAELSIGGKPKTINVYAGDITDAQVDAVVRPSGFLQKEVDYTMTNGGAVEKAIGRIGGRQIYEQAVALAAKQEEINPHSADAKIYGANLGDSVVTDAGALEPDIKRVIHVMCHQTFGHAIDQEAIQQTVISALNQASWAGLESVIFPVIGGGISTRSHDSVITSNESAVATLNAIRAYLEAEPGSSVKNVGLIFYDRDGTETSGTIADKLNDVPAASLLTFPLTSTDGQQIDLKLAITQPEETATPEAEPNSLPIVMVAGKTYIPDELIDVLTSDELRTFSSSLLKFVRADVIDGESRGSVIFIDRFGGNHNIIYARGREKLTQEGGIFYGQDVRFQLIDAGRMYVRPTHTREQGDYLLEVTETSGTLSDGLRSSRRSRSSTEDQDRQETLRQIESILANRQTDRRIVTVTTREDR